MKKVTIIGLGGAGINFLNSLRKKELDNLDLKLLPIEDENIDKNLIEKEIIKDIIFYGSFYEVTVVVNNKDLLVYSADDSLEIGQNVKLHFEDRILRF